MTTPLNSVALLVVDMQDVFISAIPDGRRLLHRCKFAVEAARLVGMRIYLTEQMPEKLGDTNAELLELVEGSIRLPKTAFSALDAPGLRVTLRDNDVNHLVIVGAETAICVYQTVIAAANDDFDVTVLSDCVSGRRADDSVFALRALERTGCHILPAETVFYSILADAGHTAFKSYTKLVKRYGDDALISR